MPDREVDIGEEFRRGDAIDEAVRQGVFDALRRHQRLGQNVAVWRDGRVVVVPATEIEIPTEAEQDEAGASAPPARR